jgi:hypothetical protein
MSVKYLCKCLMKCFFGDSGVAYATWGPDYVDRVFCKFSGCIAFDHKLHRRKDMLFPAFPPKLLVHISWVITCISVFFTGLSHNSLSTSMSQITKYANLLFLFHIYVTQIMSRMLLLKHRAWAWHTSIFCDLFESIMRSSMGKVNYCLYNKLIWGKRINKK